MPKRKIYTLEEILKKHKVTVKSLENKARLMETLTPGTMNDMNNKECLKCQFRVKNSLGCRVHWAEAYSGACGICLLSLIAQKKKNNNNSEIH